MELKNIFTKTTYGVQMKELWNHAVERLSWRNLEPEHVNNTCHTASFKQVCKSVGKYNL